MTVLLMILAIIFGFVFYVYLRGLRVQREMGIDPDSMPIEDAVRARYQQRQIQEELKAAGRAEGDPRLGKAMAKTFGEMTGVCPACHGIVWKQADQCGHCGHPLQAKASDE